MVDQRVASHPTRPSFWRIPLLVLGVTAVGGLIVVGRSVSASLEHLFYWLVLAGAGLFGVQGGVTVGIVVGLVSSPLLPFLSASSPPPFASDVAVRFLGFIGVGLVTGMWSDLSRKRLQELNRLTDDSIQAFVRALHAVDGATARHSEQVAEYASAIAEQMKLPPEQVNRVRWAALLHDMGKLSIPPEVLNKREPLTDAEWSVMKRHPLESVRIVSLVTQLHSLLPALRHHHERIDGRGYPDGVQGPQFPLEARIISVADAFDAMTSNRAYGSSLSTTEAYAELRRHAGTQFDPQVVSAFIRFHSRHQSNNGATGSSCELAME